MDADRSGFSDRDERVLQRRAENGAVRPWGLRRPRRAPAPLPLSARSGRVVVGVSGSAASRAALRAAVAEARRSGRALVVVTAWEPPEGEAMYRRWPDRDWARHWYETARARLTDVVEQTLGGPPPGLDVTLRVVRARPGPALVERAAHPDDLLVIGAGPHRWRGAVHRHVRRHAVCPVLTVPALPVPRTELRALLSAR